MGYGDFYGMLVSDAGKSCARSLELWWAGALPNMFRDSRQEPAS